jgi:hypothetical protein
MVETQITCHDMQTGSVAHPVSYSMGVRGSSSSSKVAEAEAHHSRLSNDEI